MTDKIIKDRLINCRKSMGLSQRALALKIGVAPSVISGAESKRGVSKTLALKLSKFFNKPSDYFIDPNAEENYLKQYTDFENLELIVKRLYEENLLDGDISPNIKTLIERALWIDIDFYIKKRSR